MKFIYERFLLLYRGIMGLGGILAPPKNDYIQGDFFWRITSIWVLTSSVFLTSFRFMNSFVFLNFFVGLTSLAFELFWCLMLFVPFCFMTSFALWTLSKKMCAIFSVYLLLKSFCIYVLCFHGIISDIAMTPFLDSYFDWQNTVRGDVLKLLQ